MSTRMRIANLDEDGLKKLRQMEEAWGTVILALEPHHPLAELSVEQVQKLKALEQELGVVLIAYDPKAI
jgi:predicted DNA-binding transcriptional regulator